MLDGLLRRRRREGRPRRRPQRPDRRRCRSSAPSSRPKSWRRSFTASGSTSKRRCPARKAGRSRWWIRGSIRSRSCFESGKEQGTWDTQAVNLSVGQMHPIAVLSTGESAPTCIVFEEELEIPLGLKSLEDFRRWAVSEDFPESGRIDYIGGRIEVDMSPEDLFAHGKLKTRTGYACYINRVDADDRGHLFIDRARVSSPAADLSAEPDIVFLSHSAVDEGRVRLVPKANRKQGRYIEIEGPPDLVVEIVSDSTVKKGHISVAHGILDRPASANSGWPMGEATRCWSSSSMSAANSVSSQCRVDAEGFQRSTVMGCPLPTRSQ